MLLLIKNRKEDYELFEKFLCLVGIMAACQKIENCDRNIEKEKKRRLENDDDDEDGMYFFFDYFLCLRPL